MPASAPPEAVVRCVYCGYRRFNALRAADRLVLKCVDCKRVQPD